MRWRTIGGVLLILALAPALAGCLRSLVHSADAEAVAMGPEGVWPIHASSSRPHWLLRGAPGWEGAHQTGYGLLRGGEAVAVVRAVVFTDEQSAAAAYAKLTPEYLAKSFPSEIALVPWIDPLRTDAPVAQAEAYTYFIAEAPNWPSPFPGRLVKIRHGRVVAVVAALGLTDIQLAAGVAAMAHEAEALPNGQ
jgi:hypothetical protein